MRVWTDDRTRHGLLRRISRTRLSKPTRLGLGLRSRRWMGSRARLQTLALAVSTGTVFSGVCCTLRSSRAGHALMKRNWVSKAGKRPASENQCHIRLSQEAGPKHPFRRRDKTRGRCILPQCPPVCQVFDQILIHLCSHQRYSTIQLRPW